MLAGQNPNNTDSLLNKLPSDVSGRYEAIPEAILALSERELVSMIKPDVILERARVSFWREHERAIARGTKMQMINVYSGICSKSMFQSYITNSYKLAYLCTPPMDFDIAITEALNLGIAQLRDILATPHVDQEGKIDHNLLKAKISITKDFTDRTRGLAVQRIEQKSVSFNYEKKETVKDVDAKLDALEKELGMKEITHGETKEREAGLQETNNEIVVSEVSEL